MDSIGSRPAAGVGGQIRPQVEDDRKGAQQDKRQCLRQVSIIRRGEFWGKGQKDLEVEWDSDTVEWDSESKQNLISGQKYNWC